MRFFFILLKKESFGHYPETFPLNLELNSTKTMCYLLTIIVPENEFFMGEMKMILKVKLFWFNRLGKLVV
jgi:hypothetical protein